MVTAFRIIDAIAIRFHLDILERVAGFRVWVAFLLGVNLSLAI
jgi:hypothetical protein